MMPAIVAHIRVSFVDGFSAVGPVVQGALVDVHSDEAVGGEWDPGRGRTA